MGNWPTFTTRDAASAIAVFLFLALLTANIRFLAAQKGWDQHLSKLWHRIEQWPQIAYAIEALTSVRRRWWLWLAFGMSLGVAATLWLAPTPDMQPAAPIASTVAPDRQPTSIANTQTTAMPVSVANAVDDRIGRVTWTNLYNNLKEPPPSIKLQSTKNFAVISSSPDNSTTKNDLESLLVTTFLQSNIRPLAPPNYERDLDAPRFDAGNLAGITIHGEGAVPDFLDTVLRHCYVIRRTKDLPSGTADYYHKTNPASFSMNDTFVWLEIGKGTPLRPGACPDTPGN